MDKKVIANETRVYGERFAKKLETRMEQILLDAETLVKSYFPAKQVSASLTKLQKILLNEGISCRFDKTVSKQAIASSKDSDITDKECGDAIQYIANAVVAETESTLEACDKAIKTLAKKHYPQHRISTAKAMGNVVEASMAKQGLRFKFNPKKK